VIDLAIRALPHDPQIVAVVLEADDRRALVNYRGDTITRLLLGP